MRTVGVYYFSGWINGLGMVTKSASSGATAVGVIMIIIGALFTGLAVIDMIMLIRVSQLLRGKISQMRKNQRKIHVLLQDISYICHSLMDFLIHYYPLLLIFIGIEDVLISSL